MRYQNLTNRTRLIIIAVLLVLLTIMLIYDIGSGFFTGLAAGLLISSVLAEVVLYFRRSAR